MKSNKVQQIITVSKLSASIDKMAEPVYRNQNTLTPAVGSVSRDADVNISQMHVGLGINRGDRAMMALCLDKPIPTQYYKKILAIPHMYSVLLVKLAG